MQVSVDDAIVYYSRLPASLRYPSYHPYYVIGDAKRDVSIKPVFFVYAEGASFYYHAAHLTPIPESIYFDLQSPYGYGGPLATTDDKDFLLRAWIAYCHWCVEKNIIAEFIRFHPVLCNEKYYLGEKCYDRQTVWINLKKDELLKSYSVRVRTAIRKAMKSRVVVEWCEADKFRTVFPTLYRETMQSLNANDFYLFSDAYFEFILNMPKNKLAVCSYEDQIIAGAIFLVDEHEMEYHLSAANFIGKKLCATNLIIHEAALLGQGMGCSVLHLGGGTDSCDENPLLFFKSGFSKQRSNFNIGYYVHKPVDYQSMKNHWLNTYGAVSSRVLFYRF